MKKNSKNYIDQEYIRVILQTLLNITRILIQINNSKTIQIFQLHFKRTLTHCAAEYFVCVCACVYLFLCLCAHGGVNARAQPGTVIPAQGWHETSPSAGFSQSTVAT